jgi:hypothetical protein
LLVLLVQTRLAGFSRFSGFSGPLDLLATVGG